MPYLSVVAPAHNEEEVIERFVTRVSETLHANRLDGEILIVDDASTDRTGEILQHLTTRIPQLKVLRNHRRSGITQSTAKAYAAAQGTYIIFLPSDLESDPVEDIPKLLAPLKEGYDVTAGYRYNKTEGLIKIISSKLFNFTARVLFGVKLHDLGWIKGFRREILRDMEPLRSDWHRLFAVLAAAEGFRIKEVKTNFYPRQYGTSKFGKTGFGRVLGAFIDLLAVRFLLSFSQKPMRIFGTIGALFFLLGLTGGIYLTYIKLVLGTIGNHIPMLFLVVLLITMGIQFFAFGFLAEMIASIKDRMKR